MEGQNAIKHSSKVDLSEQELLDCSGSYGNDGCGGGLMDYSFKYMQANGIASYSNYPYSGKKGSCLKASKARSSVKVTGYKNVAASETALKSAVGKYTDSSEFAYVNISALFVFEYSKSKTVGIYVRQNMNEFSLNIQNSQS